MLQFLKMEDSYMPNKSSRIGVLPSRLLVQTVLIRFIEQCKLRMYDKCGGSHAMVEVAAGLWSGKYWFVYDVLRSLFYAVLFNGSASCSLPLLWREAAKRRLNIGARI